MTTTTAAITTTQVANKLVQLCREGKNIEAINELYADNILILEPKGAQAERVEGKAAALKGFEQWSANVEEFHSSKISEPIVADNFFSCSMEMDITLKGMGRISMNEICVYEVQEGKVVFAQFFFKVNN